METAHVDDRVPIRHPDASKEDAATAWQNCIASMLVSGDGGKDRYVAIGVDGKGRLIELGVVLIGADEWCIFHAQHPPKQDIRRKLGMTEREGKRRERK